MLSRSWCEAIVDGKKKGMEKKRRSKEKENAKTQYFNASIGV
jgi:hypothetical protein